VKGEHTTQEGNRVSTSYRFVALLATVALAAGTTTAFAHDDGGHHGRGHGHRHGGEILRSGLVGSTPTTATRPGPVLFGVSPGGAPWTIGESSARVSADRVRVRGRGLLLVNTGDPALDGTTGAVQKVAAAVYCNGNMTAAFTSAAVPLDADGDFRVDEDLATPLPSPCLAPAVLVRVAQAANAPVANGPYIAATGGNAPPATAADEDDDD
jgi:hypothetical protein